MTGILITVRDAKCYSKAVDIPDGDTRRQNERIRQLINCKYFDIVYISRDCCMFVDDEGISQCKDPNAYATLFAQYPYPILGDALIVGAIGDDITDIPDRYMAAFRAFRDCFR